MTKTSSVVGDEASEAIGLVDGVFRQVGHDGAELTPLEDQSTTSILEARDPRGPGEGVLRTRDGGRDGEHAQHLARAHVGPRGLNDVVDGGAQGSGQEHRVPEECDELARLQGAVHDVARADEGHDARQDGRQQHLSRLETGLGRRHANTRGAYELTLTSVVLEEDVFAPHAAQNSQSGHGVDAEGRQSTRGFALGGLGRGAAAA